MMVVFKMLLVVLVILICEQLGRRSRAAGARLALTGIFVTSVPVMISFALLGFPELAHRLGSTIFLQFHSTINLLPYIARPPSSTARSEPCVALVNGRRSCDASSLLSPSNGGALSSVPPRHRLHGAGLGRDGTHSRAAGDQAGGRPRGRAIRHVR